MVKKSTIGALALGLCCATAAQADLGKDMENALDLVSDRQAAPPADYKGQWWVHPRGCEYSRAGRPGETVWYLIINTAKRGCPSYIVGHSPYRDVY